jgi:hypothetical protein
MNEPQSPSLHSWSPVFGQDPFPGIEQNSFSGPPEVINPTVLPAQVTTVAKTGLPFNLSNLGDLKAMVDRMGGIDGVLATMGKFQKFMATMQQVAPMIKLFIGKGGKAVTANSSKKVSRRRRPKARPSARKSHARRPIKRR